MAIENFKLEKKVCNNSEQKDETKYEILCGFISAIGAIGVV